MTLHFYSPHAYRYVRKMFNTSLPHPHTVEKWYLTVDGSPGFSECSFQALRARAAARTTRMVAGLLMDETVIRQQLEWNGNTYQGFIDMGTGTDDDSLPLAKEALVSATRRSDSYYAVFVIVSESDKRTETLWEPAK